jgi:hypothetical protein
VQQRRPWSRPEIEAILSTAEEALATGASAGPVRQIVAKANERFLQDVQSKNRLIYAAGMFLGALILGLISVVLVSFAEEGRFNLASSNTLVSLFVFAGLGSVTSFLTRLPSLDLRAESSQRLVLLSAASRPVVAIGFASVIYLVLRYKLVNLQVASDDAAAQDALSWIAAFLCGFSERFASDLLGRLPFAKVDNTAPSNKPEA